MKKISIIIISIILLILDNSLMASFSIMGGYPNLLLSFVISYSLLNNKNEAVFVGVLSGLLQDIYYFNGFGVNSLINMFLCILASIVGDNIVKGKRTVPVFFMIIITILKEISILIIFNFINIKVDLDIFAVLISAIENSILVFFLYKYILDKLEKSGSNQQWRFR